MLIQHGWNVVYEPDIGTKYIVYANTPFEWYDNVSLLCQAKAIFIPGYNLFLTYNCNNMAVFSYVEWIVKLLACCNSTLKSNDRLDLLVELITHITHYHLIFKQNHWSYLRSNLTCFHLSASLNCHYFFFFNLAHV